MALRFGIDLGGTKTEIAVLSQGSEDFLLRRRTPTPHSYEGVILNIKEMIESTEKEIGETGSVGIGIPGAISPKTGLIKNANSTWLNGKPLKTDLELALNRPVKIANDADCLALSEAIDGAGKDAETVWAVILGTGVGSGIVVRKQILSGPNAICGEWGHNPLPYTTPEESESHPCYCGRNGCIETFLSGPALCRDYKSLSRTEKTGAEIDKAAQNGDRIAEIVLRCYEDRLARAMASVINILDPHIIVLGGGVSNMTRLYDNLPKLWGKYVFSDYVDTKIVPAKFGDSSGVRGAAWLWNRQD